MVSVVFLLKYNKLVGGTSWDSKASSDKDSGASPGSKPFSKRNVKRFGGPSESSAKISDAVPSKKLKTRRG